MQIETFDYSGVSRRRRVHPIHLVIIHATRGPVSQALQYPATINWIVKAGAATRARRRLRGFGPMSDFCVGSEPGQVAQFGDWRATRSNWGAGYGGSSRRTWGADEYGISIECAQSDKLEAYTDVCVEATAQLCRDVIIPATDIPVVHLPFVTQRKDQDFPRGFTAHDETANGKKLGKTDPGPRWPWDDFLALVRSSRVHPGADLEARVEQLEGGNITQALQIARLRDRVDAGARGLS